MRSKAVSGDGSSLDTGGGGKIGRNKEVVRKGQKFQLITPCSFSKH